ncbi:MAG: hypothetical protein KGY76_09400 [Candidatus Thermoplasmatota archaeon]|nr:hypothetical protein [Candidatus Thermoplasmatota archaeon]
MPKGKSESKDEGKKGKSDSDAEEESLKSIGQEDWTFDGKKGYEKPSHSGPDVKTMRKKEEVDEITSERKEGMVDEITGDKYRSDRIQEQTIEGKERVPPPPSEPEETGSQEEEPIEEKEIERYEIKHGMPDVAGKTAERRSRSKMDEEIPRGDEKRPADPVNSRLVKDLKEEVSELSEKVDGFSEELNDIEEEISLLTSRMDRLEKREVNHEKVEEKLKELSALYDLLSTDVSPFMDLDYLGQEKEEDEEDEAPEPTPEEKREKELKEEQAKLEDYDMEAMIDWIDFLYKKTGGNLEDALDYYKELGWIGDPLKENILSYSEGIKTDIPEDEDKIIGEDGSVEKGEGDWKLSPQDHKESLRYIQAIKNDQGGLEETESGSESGRGEERRGEE